MIRRTLKQLRSEKPEVRKRAVVKLSNSTDERAVEPLVRILNDEVDSIREGAMEILSKIGAPAIQPLIQRLNHQDMYVRKAVVETLNKMGAPAVQPLVEVLDDQDMDIRRAGAWTLGELRANQAIQPLIEALKDMEEDLRRTAAEALGKIGYSKAVLPLIGALGDTNKGVRKAGILALGRIGVGAVQPLMEVVERNGQDGNTRIGAVDALGEIGDELAGPLLIEVLGDESEDTRRAAAEALGKIGYEEATKPLISLLSDENLKSVVAEALGRIGKAVVQATLEKLNDDGRNSQLSAVSKLSNTMDKQFVHPLTRLLEDENLRSGAAYALRKIKGSVAPPLVKTLRNENENVRETVVALLAKAGDERTVQPLSETLLKDHCWNVRRESAYSLGEIGTEKAIQPLTDALEDESKYVRLAAAAALGKIANEPSSQERVTSNDGCMGESAAYTLDRTANEQTVNRLLALLKDEDVDVRKEATTLLGKLGKKQAVRPLSALLGDKNLEVRKAASLALNRIESPETPIPAQPLGT